MNCLSEGLMALLGDIGKAYVCLTHYDCAKALQLFSSLPPQHYNTGWVLCQVNYTFADTWWILLLIVLQLL